MTDTTLYKYSGAGNTFVIIHLDKPGVEIPLEEIVRLCSADEGLGTDGFIILEPSETCDFRMRFYNNDGSSGMMCGNGGRCIVDLAQRIGIKPSGENGAFVFEAPDGVHQGSVLSRTDERNSVVSISMRPVEQVDRLLLHNADGKEFIGYRMNTGTDHLVVFRNDLESLDIIREGQWWRYDGQFKPRGVNVNFVHFDESTGAVRMRTYEKGVEAETLSCGTGVIATAIASFLEHRPCNKYTINSPAHTFAVSFTHKNKAFEDICLEGPVELC